MNKVNQLLQTLLQQTEGGNLLWEKISPVAYETKVVGQSGELRFVLTLVPTTAKAVSNRFRFKPEIYLPYAVFLKVEALVPMLTIVDAQKDIEIASLKGDDPQLDQESKELMERLYEMVERKGLTHERGIERALQVLCEAQLSLAR